MTPAAVSLPIEILLVEDNPGDARLAIEALKDGKLRNRISVVTDGEQAMQFLKRRHPYTNAVRPDLVLLDLNLPRKDGREVLAKVRADPVLDCCPWQSSLPHAPSTMSSRAIGSRPPAISPNPSTRSSFWPS